MITNKNILKKIEAALDDFRPYLEADGGDISLVEVTDDYVVKVKLLGACETCQVSMMTLKNGVELAVKSAVPKVKEVVEVGSLSNA
ncbi:MAG: NifU family protein [Flavobacteriales bacterium]